LELLPGVNGGNIMKKKIPDPNKMKKISGPKLLKRGPIAKVRITTYLDQDILKELRQMAKTHRGKYQTLLNKLLRAAITKDLGDDIQTRLQKLESAVFG